MGPSMKDVAALAGVSARTVSNVVNDAPHVAPDTRERVQQALRDLRFRPNQAARSLRQGRTGLLGLVVPEVDSSYFSELAALLAAEAEARGWTLLIDSTNGDPERERRLLDGAGAHTVDGLLLSPWSLTAQELSSHRGTVPLVLLGEHGTDGVVDHVVVDNAGAAAAVTGHLAALGRRRIAAVGTGRRLGDDTGRLRLQGHRRALVAAGLAPDPALEVSVAAMHRADGAAAVRALLERTGSTGSTARPDAIFCFTDELALGALRVVLERGLRVPEDVAIAGFDDIEDGRYATPSLTTVAPDKRALARRAVDCLADRLADRQGGAGRDGGNALAARTVVVGHELRVRESTAGRGAARP